MKFYGHGGSPDSFKVDCSIMQESEIAYYICSILSFIPAIVLHEVMHGFAANRLGDPTAKQQGRLSLNPLKHIDPFGTVIMPFLLMMMNMPVFGYAKPVPYNPAYFKNPKRDDFIVGMAGPAANLAMALVAGAAAWLLSPLSSTIMVSNAFLLYFYYLFLPLFTLINLYLMFFNLLPIPPLDGSSIIALLIPERHLPTYYRLQQWAFPVFLIIVIGIPYIFNFNPIGIYLNATAGNLAGLLLPPAIY